ncbi:DUF4835 family protein [Leadbetterella byssophila]|uniref:type IX secretion system protein PorD n=1 Tax=Leadbetterella byssophila TaxID=316068 RepID=UPI00399FE839
MKKIFILFVLLGFKVQAQELQCQVRVNFSQLSSNTSGDREIFAELERSISDFMNGQRWTNDIFAPGEKIKCNLNINLLKSSGQYNYSGTAQFQVLRPVYGSTYESVIFSFLDRNFDVSFAPESRQMIFNEQIFTSNLTSMLAFYSLTALAIDYDSFSRFGGNPFVDRLYNIVTLAGNAVGGAWLSSADIRDRYWIMENLRNPQFAVYRERFYEYHRLGLDILTEKPAEGRKIMMEFIETVKTLNELRPSATLLTLLMDAKGEEFTGVFSEASKKEKEAVYKICTTVSPDKTEIMRSLLN